VFQQLVRGLSYLHYMGVLHRDIKPSNVLGDREQGIVKVSDFGVSSFTKLQKSARILGEDDIICVGSCGTPAFLPPEASGAGFDFVYHGRPADVWSLGVTFYVLLCGSLPFRGVDRASTAQIICKQKLKIPAHVPQPAKDLLMRMLEKDPSKRATMVWVSNHPWIDVGNWKTELSEKDLQNPGKVSTQELALSLSLPQSIRKTIKKRSHSFVKYSTSFVTSMLPSPAAMIRPLTENNHHKASSSGETSSGKPRSASHHWVFSEDFDLGEVLKEWLCACTGSDRKESETKKGVEE